MTTTLKKENIVVSVQMPQAEFLQMILKAQKAIPQEWDMRKALNGFFLEFFKEGIAIAATDGKIMFHSQSAKITSCHRHASCWKVVIPKSELPKIKRAVGKTGTVAVHLVEDPRVWLCCSSGELTAIETMQNIRLYPQWRSVTSHLTLQNEVARVTFDVKDFKTIIAKHLAGVDHVKLILLPDWLQIGDVHLTPSTYAGIKITNIRRSVETCEFVFCRDSLVKIFRSLTSKSVQMRLCEVDNHKLPVVFTPVPNPPRIYDEHWVVMPLKKEYVERESNV